MMKTRDELFSEFLWQAEFTRKLRPETLRGYRDVYATFNKLMPDMALKDINSHTLTLFFKKLHERQRVVGKGIIRSGVKKSTIATYWSKLNSFFLWAEINGHISANPFKGIAYPSPVYEDKQFLKKEQIEKIFNAVYTHYDDNLLILKRNVMLFNLLLFCGLRKEELLLLQIRDFDLVRKTVTIRGETSKSAVSRCLPITFHLVQVFKDYLAQRREYTTGSLLVSSTTDRALSAGGLLHIIRKLNTTSKVKFHLHQFRHTFAINFLKQSNNVYKLKQLMGHKDIRMTAVYLRCLPTDEMRADIEKISLDSLI